MQGLISSFLKRPAYCNSSTFTNARKLTTFTNILPGTARVPGDGYTTTSWIYRSRLDYLHRLQQQYNPTTTVVYTLLYVNTIRTRFQFLLMMHEQLRIENSHEFPPLVNFRYYLYCGTALYCPLYLFGRLAEVRKVFPCTGRFIKVHFDAGNENHDRASKIYIRRWVTRPSPPVTL